MIKSSFLKKQHNENKSRPQRFQLSSITVVVTVSKQKLFATT